MAKKLCGFMVAALALSGCTSLTTIQTAWRDPTFTRAPFDRVAVVALFDTAAESRTFEQAAAEALEQRGADAVPAYTILGDDEEMYEQAELRDKLAAADVDGILIYRLIAVDERDVYRNPEPYIRAPGGIVFGDSRYSYYYPSAEYYWLWRSTYDVTHSPGYWESLAFVIVEASLYDAERDRLVWTAKTETIDDTRFQALADSIVERITNELAANDVIASPRS